MGAGACCRHDGLGRYGDPLNPDGDLSAVREMRALLKPRGWLLLGVPTNAWDRLVFPLQCAPTSLSLEPAPPASAPRALPSLAAVSVPD